MLYYFVTTDGRIETEDAPRGWFTPETNTGMFTQRKLAVLQARKNIRDCILELEERLKELK